MPACVAGLALRALSGGQPQDRISGVLELFPIFLGAPLPYACIFVHAGMQMRILRGAGSLCLCACAAGPRPQALRQGRPLMFFALLGAATALLAWAHLHDRQLLRLPRRVKSVAPLPSPP